MKRGDGCNSGRVRKEDEVQDMQYPQGKGEEGRTVNLKRNGWEIMQNECNKT
jgi:hypothetical protein